MVLTRISNWCWLLAFSYIPCIFLFRVMLFTVRAWKNRGLEEIKVREMGRIKGDAGRKN
jgi:hypothetical protein